MDSPCAPWHRPVGLFSSKRLSPFVTKRPDAPRPGCRPRCRAESFLLSFSIAKRKKQRNKLPSVKCFARCDGRPGLCPWTLPPFEKGGRKLYRPSAPVGGTSLSLQAPPEGRGVHGGTGPPREAQRSPSGLPGPSAEGPCAGRVGRDSGGIPEGVTPAARRIRSIRSRNQS